MNTLFNEFRSIRKHRLSREDFHCRGTAGILTEDDRVELIYGEPFNMAPIGSMRAFTMNMINCLLVQRLGRRYLVRLQDPICLNRYSEPKPDIVIVTEKDYADAHPSSQDVQLVIEGADTSPAYDRNVKLPLYALHDIPEVWLIDVNAGHLEVYRTPSPEGYRDLHRPSADGSLSPVRITELNVRRVDLIPSR